MAKKTIKRPTLLWIGIAIVLLPLFLSYSGILQSVTGCPTPPTYSCYQDDYMVLNFCGVLYYADCDFIEGGNNKCGDRGNNDVFCTSDFDGVTDNFVTPVCNLASNDFLVSRCTSTSNLGDGGGIGICIVDNEICDGKDNDCDGLIDENGGCSTITTTLPRTSTTTLPSGGCTSTRWLPETSTTCSGEQFTQTSDCGVTRTVMGTKECITDNPPAGFDFTEFLDQVFLTIPLGEGNEFEVTGLIAILIGGAIILLAVV